MLTLREMQTALRRAILDEDDSALGVVDAEVETGDFTARDRIAVYRNNVFAALTDTLSKTFPVIRRLVGERFFSYAAHEFIRTHPPSAPALCEYGGAFAGFLTAFPPCRELVYLPDVARLEWLLNVAATACDEPPLQATALSHVKLDQAVGLGFRLQPSFAYLQSPWPIDRIWRTNQEAAAEETIHLSAGLLRLEVRRRDGLVVFRAMAGAEWVFREHLRDGAPLGDALDRALTVDTDFPARDALMNLFHDGAVAALMPSLTDGVPP